MADLALCLLSMIAFVAVAFIPVVVCGWSNNMPGPNTADDIHDLAQAFKSIAHDFNRFAERFCGGDPADVAKVSVDWGVPQQRENAMPTVKFVKKSALHKAAGQKVGPPKKGDILVIGDDQQATLTVALADSQGFAVPNSDTLATMTAASSDDTLLKFDAPTGLTDHYNGLKPGAITATLVVTANDGSFGPFTITQPGTVNPGAPTAATVDWGTPTIR